MNLSGPLPLAYPGTIPEAEIRIQEVVISRCKLSGHVQSTHIFLELYQRWYSCGSASGMFRSALSDQSPDSMFSSVAMYVDLIA